MCTNRDDDSDAQMVGIQINRGRVVKAVREWPGCVYYAADDAEANIIGAAYARIRGMSIG